MFSIDLLPDLSPTKKAAKELAEKLSGRWTKAEEVYRFFYLETDEYNTMKRTAELACKKKYDRNDRYGAIFYSLEEIYDAYMKKCEKRDTKQSSHLSVYNFEFHELISGMEELNEGILFIHMKCHREDIDRTNMYKYQGFIHKICTEFQKEYTDQARKKEQEVPKISWYQQIVFLFWGTKCNLLDGSLKEQIYTIKYPSLNASDFEVLLREYHERKEVRKKTLSEEYKIPYKREEFNVKENDSLFKWYENRMTGMSELCVRKLLLDCENLFQGGFADYTNISEIESAIIRYKNKVLEQHGILEIIHPKLDHEVYGLDKVDKWIKDHKDVVKLEKDAPTGFLLVGLPGTGKSATAKKVAKEFELPLVRLEMANILGGHVGDSERNMKQMLEDLKFAAPCILWIDEIEKALSGSDNKDGGNGVMQRLFGMLLTFIQENERPVFTVTTANDISKLPPEFFRNGRFDQTFSVMMPDYTGCCKITVNLLNYYDKKLGGKGEIEEETAAKVFAACVGTRENPRFLTGADIEAHIKELYWEYQKNKDTFSKDESSIAEDMKRLSIDMKVLASPNSPKSMKMIANSYLDMMQRGMTMAGSQDTVFKKDNLDLDLVRYYEYGDDDMKLPSCIRLPEELKDNYNEERGKSDKVEDWYDVVFFNCLTEAMGEEIILDCGKDFPEIKNEYVKLKRAIRNANLKK